MARRKKARSRGQIQSKGLDKWLCRVFLGRDDTTGKRRYSSKTVSGSKREAEKALTGMLNEVDGGAYVAPSKTTVKDFVEAYLDGRTDLSPKTLTDYRCRAKHDIYPNIGRKKLDQLTPMAVNELYSVTLFGDRGLSARTVAATHQVLNQALSQAVRWGMLSKNPVEHVTLPQDDEHKEMSTLSSEQVQVLLDRTSGTPSGTLWNLLLSTGMRPQEALALKWSDLDGPHIIIRRALKRIKGGTYAPGTTKTPRSRRKILLPQGTVEALKHHRIDQAKLALKRGDRFDRTGDWIFTTRDGSYLYPSHASRKWKKTLEVCGLPHFRLYDTRHTHATTLLLRGVNPKVVAERLGHSSIVVTLNVYSHVLPEMQESAAAEVEAAFFSPELTVKDGTDG